MSEWIEAADSSLRQVNDYALLKVYSTGEPARFAIGDGVPQNMIAEYEEEEEAQKAFDKMTKHLDVIKVNPKEKPKP